MIVTISSTSSKGPSRCYRRTLNLSGPQHLVIACFEGHHEDPVPVTRDLILSTISLLVPSHSDFVSTCTRRSTIRSVNRTSGYVLVLPYTSVALISCDTYAHVSANR